MKITKEVEKLENSAIKLTVTVGKKDVAQAYTDTVAKYAKTIQMPGFRKGKVPVSVLENKYGESLKQEACGDLIEKALGEIFDEFDKNKADERPVAYAQPQLEAMPEFNTAKDLKFVVTYDVMPRPEVTDLSGIEIKVPQVELTDDDLKDELEAIRERNAMVLDKNDGDAAADGDIATVNYVELDADGNEVEGTKRQDFVFTIGTEQNIYKFDKDIIGMKKDESKDLNCKDGDKDVKVRVTVTALKVRNLPELDDDLAQDVNEKYNTVEDLKNDLKKNMQNALNNRLKEMKSNDLVKQLIAKYPFDLPKSLVAMELDSRWNMMAQQFQTTPEQLEKMILASGQSKETMIEQWTGNAEDNLKGRILIESLLKSREIAVSKEEVEAKYAELAENAGVDVEEVKKYYADPRNQEYIVDEVKEQKLYDQLFAEVKVSDGDKKSFKELFENA